MSVHVVSDIRVCVRASQNKIDPRSTARSTAIVGGTHWRSRVDHSHGGVENLTHWRSRVDHSHGGVVIGENLSPALNQDKV
jgi:hypothetical protein